MQAIRHPTAILIMIIKHISYMLNTKSELHSTKTSLNAFLLYLL
jgi:hypothetical protein